MTADHALDREPSMSDARSPHLLAGGNVFGRRGVELMGHLVHGAHLRRGRPWGVVKAGRRIDTMPNALAQTWIRRGLVSAVDGDTYRLTSRGRTVAALAVVGSRRAAGA